VKSNLQHCGACTLAPRYDVSSLTLGVFDCSGRCGDLSGLSPSLRSSVPPISLSSGLRFDGSWKMLAGEDWRWAARLN